jgi:hypothetical protein
MAAKKATETDAKKTTSKKTTAARSEKKAAGEKTTATARKSTSRKKSVVNTEIYVQFWGKEVYTTEVVDSIRKIWTEEMGKSESELVDLKIYVKPEDNGAHYVINNEVRGFLAL